MHRRGEAVVRRPRRDVCVRGKGIAGSRPPGRSLSGNAIAARAAQFGAGALLSLGESSSQVDRPRGGHVRMQELGQTRSERRGGEVLCGQSAGSDQPPAVVGIAQSGRSPAPADGSPEYGFCFRAEEKLALDLVGVARLVQGVSHASADPDARYAGIAEGRLVAAAGLMPCPASALPSGAHRADGGRRAARSGQPGRRLLLRRKVAVCRQCSGSSLRRA